jgi:CBS domain containing-hemolysin-like protein
VGARGRERVSVFCKKKSTFRISDNKMLDDLLKIFIKKKIHMAVVFDKNDEFVGVVTLEDVIEEIIGREIVDERDRYIDIQKGKKFR